MNKTNHALIFANGPYQLMVGLACTRKHFGCNPVVDVITYDMPWQKDLENTTVEFIEILNLNHIKVPYEFRKSDISNRVTYRFRAFLNHLLFFFYAKRYGDIYIFIPKLYGSPERAILLASLNKSVFVFDDGFGIYLDPGINIHGFDRWLYTRFFKFQGGFKPELYISPRRPGLATYKSYFDIPVSQEDYSHELSQIIGTISDHQAQRIQRALPGAVKDKKIILVSLPRIILSGKDPLCEALGELLKSIEDIDPGIHFLFKPHPRDIAQDLNILKEQLMGIKNWSFLPEFTWCQPVEVISSCLDPILLLSGWSTVGVNQDLMGQTKVMVFDFLSFDIPSYNDHAKKLMIKAGTYSGADVKDAIMQISAHLTVIKQTSMQTSFNGKDQG